MSMRGERRVAYVRADHRSFQTPEMFLQIIQSAPKRAASILMRRSLRVFSTSPVESPKDKTDNAGAAKLKSAGTHKVDGLEKRVNVIWDCSRNCL